MRRVSVFGSTGSIGVSTLDLLQRAGGAGVFDVVALTGGRNIALLAAQAKAMKAQLAVTCYDACYEPLRAALAGTGIEVAAGKAAIADAADRPADWIMSAIVGTDGLTPSLRAVRHGTTLALANKESLVMAGPLLLSEAKRYGATVLPVDSEHSAIFQALVGEDIAAVSEITLTASGGPFRTWTHEQLATATLQQAQKHPNWDMGQRITIDSASMFNKALEVIEVKEFFGVSPDKIGVVVHPQSIIHSMVAFRDGAVMAHMGTPDMRHAIGYALNWPTRQPLPVAKLDLPALGQMTFEAPDTARFPALDLAWRVMELGGMSGAAFNAAKDTALDAFIDGRIRFMDMARVVDRVLTQLSSENALKADAIDLDMIVKMTKLAASRAKSEVTQFNAAPAGGVL